MTAGAIVEGKALIYGARCSRFEVDADPGLGSKAFSKRIKERSVRVPVRPPWVLDGEVLDKQGTPMVKRGSAAASASSETNAASLKDVYIACTEMTPSETGRPVESEGRWMKGSRKARSENGLEGLSLLTVSPSLRCQ